MSNPAYSRHVVLKKLLSQVGDVLSLNLYKKKNFLKKVIYFLCSKRLLKKELNKVHFETIDAVVLTTISYPAMKYIKKISTKYKKTLVIDCVEWASPEEKKLGKMSPSYIHNTRIIEHLIDKNVRTISISSYLASYFKSKGVKTAIIPNLVDVNLLSYQKKQENKKIELLFAGYPQKKDAINIVIEGALLLNENDQEMINLTIAGIDEKSFFNKFKYLSQKTEDIKKITNFVGIVSSDSVKDLYIHADFSVLLRNDSLRVCKAGFPTKLLDSFKYSTPMIANSSSDIKQYLIDEKSGFLVKGFSAKAFADTLRTIIALRKTNKLNIEELSKTAFNTCLNNFNYLFYVDIISALLHD